METRIKLPVGIESFEEIRKYEYYYVDKTLLIEQVLEEGSKVKLFTRPRRFGKTLNMSMLKSFFEIGTDPSLFEGLHISESTQLCAQYMGRYPVISISLKSVGASSYKEAVDQLVDVINRETFRFMSLIEDPKLSAFVKKKLEDLLSDQMTAKTLESSLVWLSMILEKKYGQKVVVLIDEYDVPLQKAYMQGYYDKMVLLISNLFGNVLKTNESLAFAVLTGCLRIAKESIFTGLNNFSVYSITDEDFDESFGFTDNEVREILCYYGLEGHFGDVKEWYDGYRFGNADVYCPWDVVNYCRDHVRNPNARVKNYWMNTSGNDVIDHLIDGMDQPGSLIKDELERLVNGDYVDRDVNEMITYKDLYANADNLWSTLFMTGYLTQRGRVGDSRYRLAIPNREIQNVMINRILSRFKQEVSGNRELLGKFCEAMLRADAGSVEHLLAEYMAKTVSIRDSFVKSLQENFYHGLLLGIFGYQAGWSAESNRESGDGFSDIMIRARENDLITGIVIELKYSKIESGLERDCRDALNQINTRNYIQSLQKDGCKKILKYGIAFWHQKCRVMVEQS